MGGTAAAKRDILPGVEHRQSRSLNNWIEVSQQPTRRRERQMQRFKSAGLCPAFFSALIESTVISSSAVIASPPTNIVPLVILPFGHGTRSSELRLPIGNRPLRAALR